MKGTYIGEFQEIVLLAILILEDNAYGITIQEEIQKQINRKVSRGALHAALVRLEEKGFIQSTFGGATPERGGRRKRFYTVTSKGLKALQTAKENRDKMWKAIPKFSI